MAARPPSSRGASVPPTGASVLEAQSVAYSRGAQIAVARVRKCRAERQRAEGERAEQRDVAASSSWSPESSPGPEEVEREEDDDDEQQQQEEHDELRARIPSYGALCAAASTLALTHRTGGSLKERQQRIESLGSHIVDCAYLGWDTGWAAGPSESFRATALTDTLSTLSFAASPAHVLILGAGKIANLVREVNAVESLYRDAEIEFVAVDIVDFDDADSLPANVERVTAMYSEMPSLGDASFDLVIASWSLYRVQDMADLAGELERVMADQAAFVAVQTFSSHVALTLASLLNNASGLEVRHYCDGSSNDEFS
jgi:hypothetical protein